MRQYTYMMLKPDAFEDAKNEKIVQDLQAHGLHIETCVEVDVTMDVMKTLLEHYKEVIDSMSKDFNFPGKLFNTFYYEGPHKIMPMKVAYDGEEDIISYSRALIGKTNPQDAGPDTIRGKYSNDSYELAGAANRLVNNLIHASDSAESAKRELAIWESYFVSK